MDTMKVTNSALTQQQLLAVEMLANGSTQAAAARKIGINRTTIANWLKNEGFSEALHRRSLDVLKEIVPEALHVLRSQMNNPKSDPYVRQNAARDLLTRAGITGADRNAQPTQIILEVSPNMPELGMGESHIAEGKN